MAWTAEQREAALAERQRRAAFFESARAHTPIVGVDSNGLRFLVSTDDHGLGLRFFTKRRRIEAKTLPRALDVIDSDLGVSRERVFLDVGANIGTVCLTAVAFHGFRRAVALEPEPTNFSLLRANVALNGLDGRVEALQLAAAETSGTAELVLSGKSSGSHRLREVAAKPREAIKVETVTIDGALDRLEIMPADIGLLWIDVNGFEAQVLAGAARLLAARVPVVFEASAQTASLPALVGSYRRALNLRTLEEIRINRLGAAMAGLRKETDVLLIP